MKVKVYNPSTGNMVEVEASTEPPEVDMYCPLCGADVKSVLVQPNKKIPGEAKYRRKISRYECSNKCGWTDTPFNNDREKLIARGDYDKKVNYIYNEE